LPRRSCCAKPFLAITRSNEDVDRTTARTEIKEACARLNGLALPAAKQRLADLGVDGSGAFNFYRVRIERDDLFTGYELDLAEALLADPDYPGAMHEIGGGYGSLSWLMAALGSDVVCLERDDRRYAGAAALLEVILAGWPELQGRLDVLHASFPSPRLEPGGAWAVATNLVATTTANQRMAIVAGLCRYDSAVIDTDRFLEPADTEDKRVALAAELASAGLILTPYLDLGTEARFTKLVPAGLATG
jgi:hypothetical protein